MNNKNRSHPPRPSDCARIEPLEARQLLSTTHHTSHRHRATAASQTLTVAPFTHATGLISQIRDGSAATVLGGKAFFAGGMSNLALSDVVDIYNGASQQWSVAHLSAARQAIVAVSVGDKAIFAGGLTDSPGDGVDTVDIYDSTTDSWTATHLSEPRAFPGAAVIGTKAIIAGGEGSQPSPTADVYDSATNQWSVQAVPAPLEATIGLTLGNIAIFPDFDTEGFGEDSVMDVYNSTTNSWSVASAPSDLSRPGVAVGNKAVFSNRLGTALQIYDAASGTWTSTTPIAGVGPSQDAIAVGSKVIFAGRLSSAPLDVYDVAASAWSRTSPLSFPRAATGATALGRTAIFAGGNNGGYDDDKVVDFYTDTSPTAVLSGSLQGRRSGRPAEVILTNTGDARLTDPLTVNIYATSARKHHGAILLGTVTLSHAVAIGGELRLQVPLSVPSTAPADTYHIVATVAVGKAAASPLAAGLGTIKVR